MEHAKITFGDKQCSVIVPRSFTFRDVLFEGCRSLQITSDSLPLSSHASGYRDKKSSSYESYTMVDNRGVEVPLSSLVYGSPYQISRSLEFSIVDKRSKGQLSSTAMDTYSPNAASGYRVSSKSSNINAPNLAPHRDGILTPQDADRNNNRLKSLDSVSSLSRATLERQSFARSTPVDGAAQKELKSGKNTDTLSTSISRNDSSYRDGMKAVIQRMQSAASISSRAFEEDVKFEQPISARPVDRQSQGVEAKNRINPATDVLDDNRTVRRIDSSMSMFPLGRQSSVNSMGSFVGASKSSIGNVRESSFVNDTLPASPSYVPGSVYGSKALHPLSRENPISPEEVKKSYISISHPSYIPSHEELLSHISKRTFLNLWFKFCSIGIIISRENAASLPRPLVYTPLLLLTPTSQMLSQSASLVLKYVLGPAGYSNIPILAPVHITPVLRATETGHVKFVDIIRACFVVAHSIRASVPQMARVAPWRTFRYLIRAVSMLIHPNVPKFVYYDHFLSFFLPPSLGIDKNIVQMTVRSLVHSVLVPFGYIDPLISLAMSYSLRSEDLSISSAVISHKESSSRFLDGDDVISFHRMMSIAADSGLVKYFDLPLSTWMTVFFSLSEAGTLIDTLSDQSKNLNLGEIPSNEWKKRVLMSVSLGVISVSRFPLVLLLLCVCQSARSLESSLASSNEYEKKLIGKGAAFDSVVDNRISKFSRRNLLLSIAANPFQRIVNSATILSHRHTPSTGSTLTSNVSNFGSPRSNTSSVDDIGQLPQFFADAAQKDALRLVRLVQELRVMHESSDLNNIIITGSNSSSRQAKMREEIHTLFHSSLSLLLLPHASLCLLAALQTIVSSLQRSRAQTIVNSRPFEYVKSVQISSNRSSSVRSRTESLNPLNTIEEDIVDPASESKKLWPSPSLEAAAKEITTSFIDMRSGKQRYYGSLVLKKLDVSNELGDESQQISMRDMRGRRDSGSTAPLTYVDDSNYRKIFPTSWSLALALPSSHIPSPSFFSLGFVDLSSSSGSKVEALSAVTPGTTPIFDYRSRYSLFRKVFSEACQGYLSPSVVNSSVLRLQALLWPPHHAPNSSISANGDSDLSRDQIDRRGSSSHTPLIQSHSVDMLTTANHIHSKEASDTADLLLESLLKDPVVENSTNPSTQSPVGWLPSSVGPSNSDSEHFSDEDSSAFALQSHSRSNSIGNISYAHRSSEIDQTAGTTTNLSSSNPSHFVPPLVVSPLPSLSPLGVPLGGTRSRASSFASLPPSVSYPAVSTTSTRDLGTLNSVPNPPSISNARSGSSFSLTSTMKSRSPLSSGFARNRNSGVDTARNSISERPTILPSSPPLSPSLPGSVADSQGLPSQMSLSGASRSIGLQSSLSKHSQVAATSTVSMSPLSSPMPEYPSQQLPLTLPLPFSSQSRMNSPSMHYSLSPQTHPIPIPQSTSSVSSPVSRFSTAQPCAVPIVLPSQSVSDSRASSATSTIKQRVRVLPTANMATLDALSQAVTSTVHWIRKGVGMSASGRRTALRVEVLGPIARINSDMIVIPKGRNSTISSSNELSSGNNSNGKLERKKWLGHLGWDAFISILHSNPNTAQNSGNSLQAGLGVYSNLWTSTLGAVHGRLSTNSFELNPMLLCVIRLGAARQQQYLQRVLSDSVQATSLKYRGDDSDLNTKYSDSDNASSSTLPPGKAAAEKRKHAILPPNSEQVGSLMVSGSDDVSATPSMKHTKVCGGGTIYSPLLGLWMGINSSELPNLKEIDVKKTFIAWASSLGITSSSSSLSKGLQTQLSLLSLTTARLAYFIGPAAFIRSFASPSNKFAENRKLHRKRLILSKKYQMGDRGGLLGLLSTSSKSKSLSMSKVVDLARLFMTQTNSNFPNSSGSKYYYNPFNGYAAATPSIHQGILNPNNNSNTNDPVSPDFLVDVLGLTGAPEGSAILELAYGFLQEDGAENAVDSLEDFFGSDSFGLLNQKRRSGRHLMGDNTTDSESASFVSSQDDSFGLHNDSLTEGSDDNSGTGSDYESGDFNPDGTPVYSADNYSHSNSQSRSRDNRAYGSESEQNSLSGHRSQSDSHSIRSRHYRGTSSSLIGDAYGGLGMGFGVGLYPNIPALRTNHALSVGASGRSKISFNNNHNISRDNSKSLSTTGRIIKGATSASNLNDKKKIPLEDDTTSESDSNTNEVSQESFPTKMKKSLSSGHAAMEEVITKSTSNSDKNVNATTIVTSGTGVDAEKSKSLPSNNNNNNNRPSVGRSRAGDLDASELSLDFAKIIQTDLNGNDIHGDSSDHVLDNLTSLIESISAGKTVDMSSLHENGANTVRTTDNAESKADEIDSKDKIEDLSKKKPYSRSRSVVENNRSAASVGSSHVKRRSEAAAPLNKNYKESESDSNFSKMQLPQSARSGSKIDEEPAQSHSHNRHRLYQQYQQQQQQYMQQQQQWGDPTTALERLQKMLVALDKARSALQRAADEAYVWDIHSDYAEMGVSGDDLESSHPVVWKDILSTLSVPSENSIKDGNVTSGSGFSMNPSDTSVFVHSNVRFLSKSASNSSNSAIPSTGTHLEAVWDVSDTFGLVPLSAVRLPIHPVVNASKSSTNSSNSVYGGGLNSTMAPALVRSKLGWTEFLLALLCLEEAEVLLEAVSWRNILDKALSKENSKFDTSIEIDTSAETNGEGKLSNSMESAFHVNRSNPMIVHAQLSSPSSSISVSTFYSSVKEVDNLLMNAAHGLMRAFALRGAWPAGLELLSQILNKRSLLTYPVFLEANATVKMDSGLSLPMKIPSEWISGSNEPIKPHKKSYGESVTESSDNLGDYDSPVKHSIIGIRQSVGFGSSPSAGEGATAGPVPGNRVNTVITSGEVHRLKLSASRSTTAYFHKRTVSLALLAHSLGFSEEALRLADSSKNNSSNSTSSASNGAVRSIVALATAVAQGSLADAPISEGSIPGLPASLFQSSSNNSSSIAGSNSNTGAGSALSLQSTVDQTKALILLRGAVMASLPLLPWSHSSSESESSNHASSSDGSKIASGTVHIVAEGSSFVSLPFDFNSSHQSESNNSSTSNSNINSSSNSRNVSRQNSITNIGQLSEVLSSKSDAVETNPMPASFSSENAPRSMKEEEETESMWKTRLVLPSYIPAYLPHILNSSDSDFYFSGASVAKEDSESWKDSPSSIKAEINGLSALGTRAAHLIFSQFDADCDGVLSPSEAAAMWAALAPPALVDPLREGILWNQWSESLSNFPSNGANGNGATQQDPAKPRMGKFTAFGDDEMVVQGLRVGAGLGHSFSNYLFHSNLNSKSDLNGDDQITGTSTARRAARSINLSLPLHLQLSDPSMEKSDSKGNSLLSTNFRGISSSTSFSSNQNNLFAFSSLGYQQSAPIPLHVQMTRSSLSRFNRNYNYNYNAAYSQSYGSMGYQQFLQLQGDPVRLAVVRAIHLSGVLEFFASNFSVGFLSSSRSATASALPLEPPLQSLPKSSSDSENLYGRSSENIPAQLEKAVSNESSSKQGLQTINSVPLRPLRSDPALTVTVWTSNCTTSLSSISDRYFSARARKLQRFQDAVGALSSQYASDSVINSNNSNNAAPLHMKHDRKASLFPVLSITESITNQFASGGAALSADQSKPVSSSGGVERDEEIASNQILRRKHFRLKISKTAAARYLAGPIYASSFWKAYTYSNRHKGFRAASYLYIAGSLPPSFMVSNGESGRKDNSTNSGNKSDLTNIPSSRSDNKLLDENSNTQGIPNLIGLEQTQDKIVIAPPPAIRALSDVPPSLLSTQTNGEAAAKSVEEAKHPIPVPVSSSLEPNNSLKASSHPSLRLPTVSRRADAVVTLAAERCVTFAAFSEFLAWYGSTDPIGLCGLLERFGIVRDLDDLVQMSLIGAAKQSSIASSDSKDDLYEGETNRGTTSDGIRDDVNDGKNKELMEDSINEKKLKEKQSLIIWNEFKKNIVVAELPPGIISPAIHFKGFALYNDIHGMDLKKDQMLSYFPSVRLALILRKKPIAALRRMRFLQHQLSLESDDVEDVSERNKLSSTSSGLNNVIEKTNVISAGYEADTDIVSGSKVKSAEAGSNTRLKQHKSRYSLFNLPTASSTTSKVSSSNVVGSPSLSVVSSAHGDEAGSTISERVGKRKPTLNMRLLQLKKKLKLLYPPSPYDINSERDPLAVRVTSSGPAAVYSLSGLSKSLDFNSQEFNENSLPKSLDLPPDYLWLDSESTETVTSTDSERSGYYELDDVEYLNALPSSGGILTSSISDGQTLLSTLQGLNSASPPGSTNPRGSSNADTLSNPIHSDVYDRILSKVPSFSWSLPERFNSNYSTSTNAAQLSTEAGAASSPVVSSPVLDPKELSLLSRVHARRAQLQLLRRRGRFIRDTAAFGGSLQAPIPSVSSSSVSASPIVPIGGVSQSNSIEENNGNNVASTRSRGDTYSSLGSLSASVGSSASRLGSFSADPGAASNSNTNAGSPLHLQLNAFGIPVSYLATPFHNSNRYSHLGYGSNRYSAHSNASLTNPNYNSNNISGSTTSSASRNNSAMMSPNASAGVSSSQTPYSSLRQAQWNRKKMVTDFLMRSSIGIGSSANNTSGSGNNVSTMTSISSGSNDISQKESPSLSTTMSIPSTASIAPSVAPVQPIASTASVIGITSEVLASGLLKVSSSNPASDLSQIAFDSFIINDSSTSTTNSTNGESIGNATTTGVSVNVPLDAVCNSAQLDFDWGYGYEGEEIANDAAGLSSTTTYELQQLQRRNDEAFEKTDSGSNLDVGVNEETLRLMKTSGIYIPSSHSASMVALDDEGHMRLALPATSLIRLLVGLTDSDFSVDHSKDKDRSKSSLSLTSSTINSSSFNPDNSLKSYYLSLNLNLNLTILRNISAPESSSTDIVQSKSNQQVSSSSTTVSLRLPPLSVLAALESPSILPGFYIYFLKLSKLLLRAHFSSLFSSTSSKTPVPKLSECIERSLSWTMSAVASHFIQSQRRYRLQMQQFPIATRPPLSPVNDLPPPPHIPVGVGVPRRAFDYYALVSRGVVSPEVDVTLTESPLDLEFVPALLDRFPTQEWLGFPLPEAVGAFAFPDGMRLSTSKQRPQVFGFVLTLTDASKVYCMSVIEWEPLLPADLLEALTVQGDDGTQLQLPHWIDLKDVLVPDTTDFARGVENLKNSSDWLEKLSKQLGDLYSPQAHLLISRYPFFDTMREAATQIMLMRHAFKPVENLDGKNDVTNENLSSSDFHPFVQKSLEYLIYDVPVPPRGYHSVGFTLFTKHIIFSRPSINCISTPQTPLSLLFQCLDLATVLQLFCGLLCERRIVVCSRHPHLLTPIIESLVSLIFPLQWASTYIPVAPTAFPDLIGAPTPYILGWCGRIEDVRPFSAESIFVDIDTCRLVLPPYRPVPTAAESTRSKLVKSLQQKAYGAGVPPAVMQQILSARNGNNNISNNNNAKGNANTNKGMFRNFGFRSSQSSSNPAGLYGADVNPDLINRVPLLRNALVDTKSNDLYDFLTGESYNNNFTGYDSMYKKDEETNNQNPHVDDMEHLLALGSTMNPLSRFALRSSSSPLVDEPSEGPTRVGIVYNTNRNSFSLGLHDSNEDRNPIGAVDISTLFSTSLALRACAESNDTISNLTSAASINKNTASSVTNSNLSIGRTLNGSSFTVNETAGLRGVTSSGLVKATSIGVYPTHTAGLESNGPLSVVAGAEIGSIVFQSMNSSLNSGKSALLKSVASPESVLSTLAHGWNWITGAPISNQRAQALEEQILSDSTSVPQGSPTEELFRSMKRVRTDPSSADNSSSMSESKNSAAVDTSSSIANSLDDPHSLTSSTHVETVPTTSTTAITTGSNRTLLKSPTNNSMNTSSGISSNLPGLLASSGIASHTSTFAIHSPWLSTPLSHSDTNMRSIANASSADLNNKVSGNMGSNITSTTASNSVKAPGVAINASASASAPLSSTSSINNINNTTNGTAANVPGAEFPTTDPYTFLSTRFDEAGIRQAFLSFIVSLLKDYARHVTYIRIGTQPADIAALHLQRMLLSTKRQFLMSHVLPDKSALDAFRKLSEDAKDVVASTKATVSSDGTSVFQNLVSDQSLALLHSDMKKLFDVIGAPPPPPLPLPVLVAEVNTEEFLQQSSNASSELLQELLGSQTFQFFEQNLVPECYRPAINLGTSHPNFTYFKQVYQTPVSNQKNSGHKNGIGDVWNPLDHDPAFPLRLHPSVRLLNAHIHAKLVRLASKRITFGYGKSSKSGFSMGASSGFVGAHMLVDKSALLKRHVAIPPPVFPLSSVPNIKNRKIDSPIISNPPILKSYPEMHIARRLNPHPCHHLDEVLKAVVDAPSIMAQMAKVALLSNSNAVQSKLDTSSMSTASHLNANAVGGSNGVLSGSNSPGNLSIQLNTSNRNTPSSNILNSTLNSVVNPNTSNQSFGNITVGVRTPVHSDSYSINASPTSSRGPSTMKERESRKSRSRTGTSSTIFLGEGVLSPSVRAKSNISAQRSDFPNLSQSETTPGRIGSLVNVNSNSNFERLRKRDYSGYKKHGSSARKRYLMEKSQKATDFSEF